MTDRHAAYIVTLADDTRTDDAEATIAALGMIRGVVSVTPVVADHNLHIAEQRASLRWSCRLMDLIRDMERGTQ